MARAHGKAIEALFHKYRLRVPLQLATYSELLSTFSIGVLSTVIGQATSQDTSQGAVKINASILLEQAGYIQLPRGHNPGSQPPAGIPEIDMKDEEMQAEADAG